MVGKKWRKTEGRDVHGDGWGDSSGVMSPLCGTKSRLDGGGNIGGEDQL